MRKFPNCCSKCGSIVETINNRDVCPNCGKLERAQKIKLIPFEQFKQSIGKCLSPDAKMSKAVRVSPPKSL